MAKSKALFYLAVTWGNVNIGEKTARVGAVVKRPTLTPTIADRNLCDRRLIGKIMARAADAQSEQGSLPGAEGNDVEVKGVFDCKGFNVSKKNISFGLTFSLADIQIEDLAHFAKRSGILTIDEIDDIPEEVDEEEDEEEAE